MTQIIYEKIVVPHHPLHPLQKKWCFFARGWLTIADLDHLLEYCDMVQSSLQADQDDPNYLQKDTIPPLHLHKMMFLCKRPAY